MTAALIDGKAIAADLRARVMVAVRGLADSHGIVPGLAVVPVGDDPASEVYIGAKKKMCAETGMRSIDHRLPRIGEPGRAAGPDRPAQRRSRR
jgi:methylenetetrahydrofolate dehydrogenase (NADP+) / methenyltetrahydrofolate cyclohydrolase